MEEFRNSEVQRSWIWFQEMEEVERKIRARKGSSTAGWTGTKEGKSRYEYMKARRPLVRLQEKRELRSVAEVERCSHSKKK